MAHHHTQFTKQEMLETEILYEDENIKIRQKCITLKTYYFPIGTSRRIPVDEIKDVELVKIEHCKQIWGLSTANGHTIWLPCDIKRLGAEEIVVIHTQDQQKIMPAFTCNDNHKALKTLQHILEQYRQSQKKQQKEKVEENNKI